MSGKVFQVTLTYTEDEARQVARTLRYFDSNVTATYEDHDRMNMIRSAILRELPKPKPPEPTGLGAVVEDAEGVRWILVDRRNGVAGWHHCDANRDRPWRFYDGIDAVTVLSEGVTP